jgi:hypothetical protein
MSSFFNVQDQVSHAAEAAQDTAAEAVDGAQMQATRAAETVQEVCQSVHDSSSFSSLVMPLIHSTVHDVPCRPASRRPRRRLTRPMRRRTLSMPQQTRRRGLPSNSETKGARMLHRPYARQQIID